MKKILAIILSITLLFLTGCSTNSIKVEKRYEDEEKTSFIPLDSPNIFTLNFKELSKKISSSISEIGISNGCNIDESNFEFDIYFKPNGQIIRFDGKLRVEDFHYADKYQDGLYFIENKYIKSEENFVGIRDTLKTNKSPMAGIEITPGTKSELLKNYLMCKQNINIYPKFMNWFDSFDFKDFLNKYVKDEPVLYRFIVNGKLYGSKDLNNPKSKIKVKFLDCSSGKITELKKKEIKNFTDKNFYCAILPYYVQDGTLQGYDETHFGDYLKDHEDPEEVPCYVSKNIIVIFNNDVFK